MCVCAFLAHVLILPWDVEAAEHYGEIRVVLERQGQIISNVDLMVMAHARSVEATLATHDGRCLLPVEGLKWIEWL